jgi:hypothetical protein
MLRLDFHAEPHWLTLIGGVRVKVRPFTAGLVAAARAGVSRVGLADADLEERFVALVVELGVLAVLEWEGVGDTEGKPAPCTPETIRATLSIYLVNNAFRRLYVEPGLAVGAEKKS